jgi:hypothetical protein
MIKKWMPVLIEWEDAHGGDNGWEDPDEIQHGPFRVITVGLLLQKDRRGITVVHSRVEEHIGGYTFVPAPNIISVKALQVIN